EPLPPDLRGVAGGRARGALAGHARRPSPGDGGGRARGSPARAGEPQPRRLRPEGGRRPCHREGGTEPGPRPPARYRQLPGRPGLHPPDGEPRPARPREVPPGGPGRTGCPRGPCRRGRRAAPGPLHGLPFRGVRGGGGAGDGGAARRGAPPEPRGRAGRSGVIRGYPRQPSLRRGETLTLHVATDRPHFRVEVYRQGAALVPMGRVGPNRCPGVDLPSGPPDRDWGWPGYRFEIPSTWPSGVYIAMLVEIDADGREHRPDTATADGTSAKALFIVRSPAPGRDASILLKLAWATYHAYNATGYGRLSAAALL